jgi:ribosomal protein S18 acetylase RimI-like enzyme
LLTQKSGQSPPYKNFFRGYFTKPDEDGLIRHRRSTKGFSPMSVEPVSPSSTELAGQPAAVRRVRMPVFQAVGGDHTLIYHFLQTIFRGPSQPEFHLSLEDPFYEPCDRLLLRRGRRLIAHVHCTHRVMHFGSLAIPASGLEFLGVAPEHQRRGLGDYLLREAEERMSASGALVGMLRTSIPRFFRRTGWALCGPASCRRADARALLARLMSHDLIPRPRRRLHIRPWLQWEQAALARIYRQNVAASEDVAGFSDESPRDRSRGAFFDGTLGQQSRGAFFDGTQHRTFSYGSLDRTNAYWQWLLKRHAYDQVYVALDGPEQLELGEISTRIVGYAAIRGEQIVELMTAPDCPRAAAELLARCCGDAIEHDRHCVLLHAPPGEPLFELFDEAGACGPPHVSEHGEVCMMRLLDPLEMLRRLCVEFDRRAAAARLPRPLDLGLLVEGRKYQVELRREGVAATTQHMGRSYLQLNVADFTRLVLGQLDWAAAVGDNRLEYSTSLARRAGQALFPTLSFWRPPWDDLPAIG